MHTSCPIKRTFGSKILALNAFLTLALLAIQEGVIIAKHLSL
jgi:hypothetical protein